MAHPAQAASETHDLEDLHTVADEGSGVGAGVGDGVGAGVGTGVGDGVGDGVGKGVGDGCDASDAVAGVVVVVQQLSPAYPFPEAQHEY